MKSPVLPAIIASIVSGALHGLHAAHEAVNELGAPLNIVHRDVSPQNIMVGVDGVSRVLDFGIGVYGRPPLLVVDEAHGQGASELALLGLVDFAALEAAAQEVELRLGHGPLQPQ